MGTHGAGAVVANFWINPFCQVRSLKKQTLALARRKVFSVSVKRPQIGLEIKATASGNYSFIFAI